MKRMELSDMLLMLIYTTAQLNIPRNTYKSELTNMLERMTL
jgi:hypothetical protein